MTNKGIRWDRAWEPEGPTVDGVMTVVEVAVPARPPWSLAVPRDVVQDVGHYQGGEHNGGMSTKYSLVQ